MPNTRVPEDKRKRIVHWLQTSELSLVDIGRQFGISAGTIGLIKKESGVKRPWEKSDSEESN